MKSSCVISQRWVSLTFGRRWTDLRTASCALPLPCHSCGGYGPQQCQPWIRRRGSSWKEQPTRSIMARPSVIVLKLKGIESVRLEKAMGGERKVVSLFFFSPYRCVATPDQVCLQDFWHSGGCSTSLKWMQFTRSLLLPKEALEQKTSRFIHKAAVTTSAVLIPCSLQLIILFCTLRTG